MPYFTIFCDRYETDNNRLLEVQFKLFHLAHKDSCFLQSKYLPCCAEGREGFQENIDSWTEDCTSVTNIMKPNMTTY